FDAGLRVILPEWPVATERLDLDAEQLRLLAFEGVALVLRDIVREHNGAVVVVDDLHAADADSIETVRYLASAAIDGLALLGAARPGESSLADELVRTLRGNDLARIARLDGLGGREVAGLVAALLDGDPPEQLVADVVARTDGVPLLVEEMV